MKWYFEYTLVMGSKICIYSSSYSNNSIQYQIYKIFRVLLPVAPSEEASGGTCRSEVDGCYLHHKKIHNVPKYPIGSLRIQIRQVTLVFANLGLKGGGGGGGVKKNSTGAEISALAFSARGKWFTLTPPVPTLLKHHINNLRLYLGNDRYLPRQSLTMKDLGRRIVHYKTAQLLPNRPELLIILFFRVLLVVAGILLLSM